MARMKCALILMVTHLIRGIDSTSTNGRCTNDPQFVFDNEGTPLTCQEIQEDERQRVILCKKDAVRESCTHTCGICCEDDPNYKFQIFDGSEKDCVWLKRFQLRISNYCDDTNFDGQKVSDGCSSACQTCPTYVNDIEIPEYLLDTTIPPFPAPSHSPTISNAPTPAVCKDNENFEFRGRQSCANIRKDEYRRQTSCQHSIVRTKCPVTCGLCCRDDDSFLFETNGGMEKIGCSALEDSEANQIKYCDRYRDGISIGKTCRNSCGKCHSRVHIKKEVPVVPIPTVPTPKGDLDDNKEATKGAAINQDTTVVKEKVPAFLIISLTFLCIGLLLAIYGAYTYKQRKEAAEERKRNKGPKRPRPKDNDEEAAIEGGEKPVPGSELYLQEQQSIGSLTAIDDGASLTMKPSQSSFVAASLTDLGKKNISATNVHRCTNFPCTNCGKDQGISFIKAPRINVERDDNGKIEFVPIPVDFVGREVTNEIKPMETLSVSLNQVASGSESEGGSISSHSFSKKSENGGIISGSSESSEENENSHSSML